MDQNKKEQPQGRFLVNVVAAGDGDDATVSRPMDAQEADDLIREIDKAVTLGRGFVTIPLFHDRLPVHMAAVHIAAWFVTERQPKHPF